MRVDRLAVLPGREVQSPSSSARPAPSSIGLRLARLVLRRFDLLNLLSLASDRPSRALCLVSSSVPVFRRQRWSGRKGGTRAPSVVVRRVPQRTLTLARPPFALGSFSTTSSLFLNLDLTTNTTAPYTASMSSDSISFLLNWCVRSPSSSSRPRSPRSRSSSRERKLRVPRATTTGTDADPRTRARRHATPYHAPIFLAQHHGFFKDEGVKVAILEPNDASDVTELIGRGSVDMGCKGASCSPLSSSS